MTNVVTVAGLGRPKTMPRGSLTPDQVRRVLAEAAARDPAAGLALRLAAVTGARRGELAALRWDDVNGNQITIDSNMAIIRHGTKGDRQAPTLRDDPTKTASQRTVTLDPGTVAAIETLRAERSPYGPWMLAAATAR